MKEKRFGPPPDFSGISSWTPEKEAKHKEVVFESVRQEEEREKNLPIESEIKRIELALMLTIANAKTAQGLKMPLSEMLQKRNEDSFHFHRVSQLAYAEHISWFEAESQLEAVISEGEKLQNDLSKYHNHPRMAKAKQPHPESVRDSRGIYENHFKARSTKGWREREMARANAYARWKAASDALNNEDLDHHDLP